MSGSSRSVRCQSFNSVKRLKAEINISTEIDKTLIGGLKISYDDQVIDLSIKNKDTIAHKLAKNITNVFQAIVEKPNLLVMNAKKFSNKG